MKKLYTYVPLQNTILKDGYLPPWYLTLEKGL